MGTVSKEGIDLVFTNPDLNRPAANANTLNTPGIASPTEIVVKGKYAVIHADAGVTVSPLNDGNTKLKVQSINGVTYRISLKKADE